MDFSWKSAILHAIYARVSAAMPMACTVNVIPLAEISFIISVPWPAPLYNIEFVLDAFPPYTIS